MGVTTFSIKHKALVQVDGKIVIDNPHTFRADKEALKGRRINIILEPDEELCPPNLRAYYWSVIVEIISDHTGNSPQKIHKYLKKQYLKYVIKTDREGNLIELDTITKLYESQFKKFINVIIAEESAEHGYVFPEPSRVYIRN
jgi:hypothetical protein